MNDQPTEAKLPDRICRHCGEPERKHSLKLSLRGGDESSPAVWVAQTFEPEQSKPVTPESLAERTVDLEKLVAELNRRNVQAANDGYQLVAQSADLAQRLDVAEEALKRHGFELGIVNDVVTWVQKSRNSCEDCGAHIYSGPPDCPRCGAPNCCPQCCQIDTLKTAAADYAKAAEASVATIRYQEKTLEACAQTLWERKETIDRLTKERDDWERRFNLKADVDELVDENADRTEERLRNERDTLKAELAKAREEAKQAHERVAIALNNQRVEQSEHARNMSGLRDQLIAARELLRRLAIPADRGGECLRLLDAAGMGKVRGNTLISMVGEICEALSAANAALEKSESLTRLAEEALKRRGFEMGVVQRGCDFWRKQCDDQVRRKRETQRHTKCTETPESDASDAHGKDIGLGETKPTQVSQSDADHLLGRAGETSAATIERLTRERHAERVLYTDVQRVAMERDTLKAELAKAKTQLRITEEGRQHTMDSLVLAAKKSEALRAELSDLQKINGEVTAHSIGLQSELSAAREEGGRLNRAYESVQASLSAANAARDKAESLTRLATAEFDTTRDELDDLRRLLAEEKIRASSANNLVGQIEKERGELRRQLTEAEEKLSDFAPTIAVIKEHHYDPAFVGFDYHNATEAADGLLPKGEYEEADGLEDVVTWLIRDRDESLATVEAMRADLEYVQKAIVSRHNYAWASSSISTPPSSHLLALKLEVAEAAYREGWRKACSTFSGANDGEAWLASATRKALQMPDSGTEAVA